MNGGKITELKLLNRNKSETKKRSKTVIIKRIHNQ